jgi:sugar phosphate isomerase/epimerase
MKLGVLVSLTGREALDRKFADLKKYGFESCQLCSWDPSMWTDENAAAVAEISEKHGITISGFWCGWEGPAAWNFYEGQLTLGLVPAEYRVTRIKNLCDGADFAKKFGVTDIITHMGFIPENPYDPNYMPLCIAIRTVASHLERNGQYLLFETGQETPVTMLRCFETVGYNNLGINLDTANLILYGKANPTDSLEVFGKYVRNIHAKDGRYPTNGRALGDETRIGDGKVDFVAFFKKLHELGYDSYVTIEREIEGDAQTADIIHARDYLSGIIADVYGK